MRCLLLSVFAAAAMAQDPQFGVQSRLVLVPVTVTDAKGQTVDGLEPNDFTVLDNGRAQPVEVDTIGTGVAPIALIVAIQASGISRAVLEKVHKIGAMIQPLVTGERGCAGVVAFSDRLIWLQECTHDDDALVRAFERIRPGAPKEARMLDAAHAAIERLSKQANSRRVLLLISESRDRGSETGVEPVAMEAQAAGVAVYAATYSAFRTAFTTKSSATAEPRLKQRPKKPSDETGTVTGAPPACGPHGCPGPPIPSTDQQVDILGGMGELLRLGKTNTSEVLMKSTGARHFHLRG